MFCFLLLCTLQKVFFFYIYKYVLHFLILKENKYCHMTLNQGSPDSVLEGRCLTDFPQQPAEKFLVYLARRWLAASGVFD